MAAHQAPPSLGFSRQEYWSAISFVKNQLNGKDPDAWRDWRQEEKGTTDDEAVGWHHWFNGHKFEQTPGDGEGQRSLACYSPWVTKCWTWPSDWTTMTFPALGIFPTKVLNSHLLYWQADSLPLSHLGSLYVCVCVCVFIYKYIYDIYVYIYIYIYIPFRLFPPPILQVIQWGDKFEKQWRFWFLHQKSKE